MKEETTKPVEEQALSESIEVKAELKEEPQRKKLPVGLAKPAFFENGDYREFSFDLPILQENPEYTRVVSMLGLNSREEATYRNEIGEISKLVYSWVGTTDEAEAFKFIKANLRRNPSSGSRVMNLLRQLKMTWKDYREQYKGQRGN